MISYEDRLNSDSAWALEEGGMFFERRSAVHDTLQRLAKNLDELGVEYAIAGAMAMFLHGFRRFTEDVDVLVTAEGLEKIHDSLEGRGYLRPFEESKNLRDTQTGVKIDFLISGQFPGDGKPGPVAFPLPSQAAVDQDGIQVVSLPRLVELKLASGQASHRLKDLGDVQQLIQHLSLSRKFVEQLDPSLHDVYHRLWDDAQKAAGDDY